MKNNILLLIFSIVSIQLFAQTATCDGTLPFEEKDGILTIEMESGVLPSGSNWQTGSEPDPNLSGSTINYIFWNGTQSLSKLSGAAITYNIKINNSGTYRIALRGRIGDGTSKGEHNDVWLKIEADDFYATAQNNATATPTLEPKPSCSSNPDRNCPEGNSTDGFFKAFMNRDPTGADSEKWGFVTNSVFDKSPYRFIWATFNTSGNYSIIVDARSSFFFMDKMVLRRTTVSDSNAQNLNNPESTCFDASLSTNQISKPEIEIFPNPTKGSLEIKNLPQNSKVTITDILGATVRVISINASTQTIDISNLKNGVYFISSNDKNNRFVKKIVKI